MFQFTGLIRAMGASIFLTIVISFLLGLMNVLNVQGTIIAAFLITYVSIGILAPLWNRETPYFATFMGSLTLTVLNFIFSIVVLHIPVFTSPLEVNDQITASIVTSFITAFLMITILKRMERWNHD
ncbi:hypothetical protein GCM10008986_25290 [Salinibacillus aidingensis]|uniref:Phage holin family protein n=1 Tax=Salinibacillus aidingensis TaxID=237684 RepID=A0ABN1BG83_9BACI